MTTTTTAAPVYRPGLAGYLAYLRLPELLAECRTGHAPDRAAALRQLLVRARPGARLRQADTERGYWMAGALADPAEQVARYAEQLASPATDTHTKAQAWLAYLSGGHPALEHLDDTEADACRWLLDQLLSPLTTPEVFPCD